MTNAESVIEHQSIVMNLEGDGRLESARGYHRHGSEVRELRDVSGLSWIYGALREFLVLERRPWVAIFAESPVLSVVTVNEAERHRIRQRGLVVYIYEPLFIRRFGGEFHPSNFGDSVADGAEADPAGWGCAELDSILAFRHCNRLGEVKITVYLCEHNLGPQLARVPRYRGIRFETLDLFQVHFLAHQRNKIPRFETRITKTFACLNYRFESYREMVVAFLVAQGLEEQSAISFFHRHNPKIFADYCPVPVSSMRHWPAVERGISLLAGRVPLVGFGDGSNPEAVDPVQFIVPSQKAGTNLIPSFSVDIYPRCFLAISNETRFFHRHGIITEKTMSPIIALRPFLVVGSPFLLQYLRELGFETFSDFWDESYDTCTDPAERLDRIFDVILEVSRWSREKQQETLQSMRGILYRNFHNLSWDLLERLRERMASAGV